MLIDESLDMTRISSVANWLPPETLLLRNQSFRASNHIISHARLVRGGDWPHPGEISLIHHGALFLDELPKFGMCMLKVLPPPLEDKEGIPAPSHTLFADK